MLNNLHLRLKTAHANRKNDTRANVMLTAVIGIVVGLIGLLLVFSVFGGLASGISSATNRTLASFGATSAAGAIAGLFGVVAALAVIIGVFAIIAHFTKDV